MGEAGKGESREGKGKREARSMRMSKNGKWAKGEWQRVEQSSRKEDEDRRE